LTGVNILEQRKLVWRWSLKPHSREITATSLNDERHGAAWASGARRGDWHCQCATKSIRSPRALEHTVAS